MATPNEVLTSLRNAIRAYGGGRNCDIARPKAETKRPYIVLNILPVGVNESGLKGGTGIIDMYVSVTSVGENQAQSELAMRDALIVVASAWTEPALLGPPEATPGAHLPQEEGTWRCDSTVKLRME